MTARVRRRPRPQGDQPREQAGFATVRPVTSPRIDRSGRGPIRSTRQHSAVRAALGRNDGFVSAQELHLQLRQAGDPIGLTTVYRQLHLLADQGEADVVASEDGSLYRMCRADEHHHHLICRSCGRTEEIAGTDIERWTREVGEAHGFSDLDHTVEVFGTCRECAAADTSA
ncbi:Fur family zinc uptake regulator [Actinomycetospora cinnamomea]|uniref:Fur family zinc uptake regulator n=1 Tax=Actinomycetospora cinnamomea TaxID=663609 RepID=A0A2U1EDR4_9PSEU|nr:Fur family zinc uptake regulator [Actinomycetospora cinnamomea]